MKVMNINYGLSIFYKNVIFQYEYFVQSEQFSNKNIIEATTIMDTNRG